MYLPRAVRVRFESHADASVTQVAACEADAACEGSFERVGSTFLDPQQRTDAPKIDVSSPTFLALADCFRASIRGSEKRELNIAGPAPINRTIIDVRCEMCRSISQDIWNMMMRQEETRELAQDGNSGAIAPTYNHARNIASFVSVK